MMLSLNNSMHYQGFLIKKLLWFLNKTKLLEEAQPARTPLSPAFFSPTFLITKLEPMNALDDMAKVKPLTLSKDATMSGGNFLSRTKKPKPLIPCGFFFFGPNPLQKATDQNHD